MNILGLGGLLNDAACAVLKDGEIVSAVEQKKIARYARAGEWPTEAIALSLQLAGVERVHVDCVAIVRPFASGPETALHLALRTEFPNSRTAVVEHHTAHAASAYYASPFDSATVLTLDRAGDVRCGARWTAERTEIKLENELYYPDSLGDLYGRVTELLGFKAKADEHKIQWLSTSGERRLTGLFLEILGIRKDASMKNWPRMDRSFFDGDRPGHGAFSAKFYSRIGLDDAAVIPDSLKPALAAGLQDAIEQTVDAISGAGETAGNLCLAGGLGLNALLVAALESSAKWKQVFVQPAAGNAGTALGAVLHAWHAVYQEKKRIPLTSLFLGPSYDAEAIKKVLENCKLRFRYLLTTEELVDTAVTVLNDHKIVAWMHGRMEFGPRALGNRSILASPLNPYSTENLNTFIKHRESFRKFAASVPAELAGEYFEVGPNARFLATVGRVRSAHRHTFESALLGSDLVRVHTVSAEDNPLYHQLLHAAGKSTGLPVLYNTSFNLFGDPLVCTPRDAVRSFYSSGIDAMFAGNFLVQK